MKDGFDLSVEVSEPYPFNPSALSQIDENRWVKSQWPLVYFIQNEAKKLAYVGESTNAGSRIRNHLKNNQRLELTTISVIGSDKFNKSATLDIESNLIQYISAEGSYKLQNANSGLVNHTYYQKDLYKNLFTEIWSRLMERKVVTKTLREIENSELFKYSPYKALNEDQYNSALEILSVLATRDAASIFVKGSAGTGKTILATYLIKLLLSEPDQEIKDYNDDELKEIQYLTRFREKCPKPKIALVIAMTSLRDTLRRVFANVPGLKPSMVVGPSEEIGGEYDLLIVDESHRLRQYKNIGFMGAFKKANQKLGLDDTGTELDWILKSSKRQLFFYDSAQSVKPSDVDQSSFDALIGKPGSVQLSLNSQMRVTGGNGFIQFVDQLLNCRLGAEKYRPPQYDLTFFDSMNDMYAALTEKEKRYGLCRLIAGYSWPWLSANENAPSHIKDIELDGLRFNWNTTDKDWVNSPTAFEEIGSIHTIQGYDLNYAGVIFGREIDYNPETQEIEIDPTKYFDTNGKRGVGSATQLRQYIINIYKTMLYRGIKGAYLYACNKNLADYLKQHVASYARFPFRVLETGDVMRNINAIPLIRDVKIAAGNFSEIQLNEETEWVEPPVNVSARTGLFICQVVGESMNRTIPNGAWCLFDTNYAGTRVGKTVLVESAEISDLDYGAGYTVKTYLSDKTEVDGVLENTLVTLSPNSDDPEYQPIVLNGKEGIDFRVIGVYLDKYWI
ncbi:MAG: DNA/RNA helicase domain-containing protein [Bacteroidota bacterium]